MKQVGIRADVVLTRTLYFDIEDDATEEQIKNKARQEISLPTNALYQAHNLLKQVKAKISLLDLKDWDTENVKYTIIHDSIHTNDDSNQDDRVCNNSIC